MTLSELGGSDSRRERRIDGRGAAIEPLEARRLMAVSLGADGWTVVTPSADTRAVYVSSSRGSDANDGLAPQRAVRTLARGQSLLRDRMPDWLLLRRGDVFESFGEWRRSGRGEQEPVLIGAWGEGPRPLVQSGTSAGFITYANGARRVDHVVLRSVGFVAHTYNHFNGNGATAGIRLTCQGSNVLIEDVSVEGYKDNVVLDAVGGRLTDVTIRRSVITGAHAGSGVGNGKSQGIYVGPTSTRVTIEENLIDHNGWRRGVNADRTYFNHNVYAKEGAEGVVVRGNVISRASFYGVKLNSGGVVAGNLFARNAESVYLERYAAVEDNVITEAVDMPQLGWGVGINTQKAPGALIRRNLIVHTASAGGGPQAGIQLFNAGAFRGAIEGNVVFNWRQPLAVFTQGSGVGSVVVKDNRFHAGRADTFAVNHRTWAAGSTFAYSGNVYSAGGKAEAIVAQDRARTLAEWKGFSGESAARFEAPSFADATRTLGKYDAVSGGAGSVESFLARAGAQRQGAWSMSLTAGAAAAWLRAGFGVSGVPVPSSNSNPEPNTPPGVREFAWDAESAPLAVVVRFSEDVRGSLARNDLRLVNLETGQRVPASAVSYAPASNVARFIFRVADVPPGQYRATLPAGSVEDADGTALATDRSFDLHLLPGDLNFDRRVDRTDLRTLGAHFATPGTFSRGDIDRNGAVETADFALLATRYRTAWSTTPVAAPSFARAAAVAARWDDRPTRPLSDLLA